MNGYQAKNEICRICFIRYFVLHEIFIKCSLYPVLRDIETSKWNHDRTKFDMEKKL